MALLHMQVHGHRPIALVSNDQNEFMK
jgi:tyrosyl-tRNA synthetase